MPIDRHVIGRIGEDQPRPRLLHQRLIAGWIERAAAQQPMPAQFPEVARPADPRLVQGGRQLIGGGWGAPGGYPPPLPVPPHSPPPPTPNLPLPPHFHLLAAPLP